jgi:hypothetical protein
MAFNGPPEPIFGPAQVPARLSLLTQAAVVNEPGDRWELAATWLPESCGGGSGTYDPCLSYVPPDLAATESIAGGPFGMVATAACHSTFGWQAADYAGRAKRRLLAQESWYLERDLWGPPTISGAPSLIASCQANGTDIGFGLAHDPVTALGCLEAELGDLNHGMLCMIHCPLQVFNALASERLVISGTAPGAAWTPKGNVVIPGDGYPGTTPHGDAPADGEQYMYGSALVEVRHSEVVVRPDGPDPMRVLGQATDRLTNTVKFWAHRYGLLAFDPCSVAGINVLCGDCHGVLS